MDLVRKRKTRGPSSPEFNRESVEKKNPNDRTMQDRALEMGIPLDVTREWALIVERADLIASTSDETLVPASRFRDLELPPRPALSHADCLRSSGLTRGTGVGTGSQPCSSCERATSSQETLKPLRCRNHYNHTNQEIR